MSCYHLLERQMKRTLTYLAAAGALALAASFPVVASAGHGHHHGHNHDHHGHHRHQHGWNNDDWDDYRPRWGYAHGYGRYPGYGAYAPWGWCYSHLNGVHPCSPPYE